MLKAIGGEEASPRHDVNHIVASSQQQGAAQCVLRADGAADPAAVDRRPFAGDDVHHRREGYVAVQRGGWSAQHLYVLHLVEGGAVVGGFGIGGIAV